MTIKEYFGAWEGFDYFTEMSDDYSVTRRGNMEKARLRELAGDNKVLLEICEKFVEYDKSLGRTDKPKIDDYLLRMVY